MPAKPWIKLNERPLPLTPAEKRFTKLGVPAKLLRKPGIKHTTWVAFSLRPLYLSMLIIFSVCLLVAYETLRQISNQNKGLFFFENTSEITTALFIAYNYVPSTLAVLYVIAWSLVDLDIKRLEPYFQLSNSARDVTSVSVLFLDYSFESSIIAPFRALRRRHHVVAFTSSVFLLISLILPPLQSSLIGVTSVSVDRPANFQSWQQFKSKETLSQAITTEYIDQASAIIVDGAVTPPYVTFSHGAPPFELSTEAGSINDTWTVSTPIFWTEPSCKELPNPDQFHKRPNEIRYNNFYNELMFFWDVQNISLPGRPDANQICSLAMNYTIPVASAGNITAIQAYWFGLHEPFSPQYLNGIASARLSNGCDAYRFLAALFKLDVDLPPLAISENIESSEFRLKPFALGAAVCKPRYFSASGSITIAANNRSVLAVDVSNEPEDISSHYLIQQFEKMVATYERPNSTWKSSEALENLVNEYLGEGIQLFATPKSINNSLQSGEYAIAVENMYKLLFGLVLGNSFNTSVQPSMLSGSAQRSSNALVIVPVFAIFSEVILAIGTLTSLAILLVIKRRSNLLRSDPDSISALCSLVTDCFGELHSLGKHGLDNATTSVLKKFTANVQCSWHKRGENQFIDAIDTSSAQATAPSNAALRTKDANDELPFFVNRLGFSIVVVALAGTIIGLSFLLVLALRRNGFTYLAASNTFAQQLLWSFTPTLIATIIDAVFVVLHRDLAVLEPWVKLRQGKVPARQSLSIRYASKLPVVTLKSTFQSHDYFLSFVSLVSVSTSVLNSVMGGLFFQSFTTVPSPPITFSAAYSPTFLTDDFLAWGDGVLSDDMESSFELVRTNITDHTKLLVWSSEDYVFVPLAIPNGIGDPGTVIQSRTSGIGMSLDCTPIPVINSTVMANGLSYEPYIVNGSVLAVGYFWWRVTIESETDPKTRSGIIATCASFFPTNKNFTMFPSASWAGTGQFEPKMLFDDSNTDLLSYCDSSAVMVMVSRPKKQPLVLACSPRLDIADFNVSFDTQGYVLSHNRISPSSRLNSSLLSSADWFSYSFPQLFAQMALISRTSNQSRFETDLSQYDWPGLLMHRLANLSSFNSTGDDVVDTSQLASDVFARVTSAFMSIKHDALLNKNGTKPQFEGTILQRSARMVPSLPAFIITFVLLALYIFTLILVMLFRRHRYSGPRMPISLGSLIPWIAQSKMLMDFEGTHHLSSDLQDEYLESLGKKYGFGWFCGRDGKLRLGIEQEPLLNRYLLDAK